MVLLSNVVHQIAKFKFRFRQILGLFSAHISRITNPKIRRAAYPEFALPH